MAPHPPFRRSHLRRNVHVKRHLLFGREREEGKDSHSRQWRLSMAVFLNRNKRPLAAPIEVAELLSEKPPPSQPPRPFCSSGGGPGEALLFRDAALPGLPHIIFSKNSAAIWGHAAQSGRLRAGDLTPEVMGEARLAPCSPCGKM